jgi:hypothetical protein
LILHGIQRAVNAKCKGGRQKTNETEGQTPTSVAFILCAFVALCEAQVMKNKRYARDRPVAGYLRC